MSVVSNALSNFQVWRERQQDRQTREQVATTEEEEDDATEDPSHPLQIPSGNDDDDEVGQLASSPTSSTDSSTPMMETLPGDEEEAAAAGEVTNNNGTQSGTTEPAPAGASPTRISSSSRRNYTLADLEEERELSRRRTSFCVLVAVFILFRLWIQAVASGDFLLLMMCLMGTSWTARFIRNTREREEELDRMIAEYNDNTEGNGNNNGNNGQNEISRRELQRLSFQAQLAMAILNSQRDMMQGGFGHPDGGENSPGVSVEAKDRWTRFRFQPNSVGYGSLTQGEDNDVEKAAKGTSYKDDEDPQCSICLGEYEEGEELVCLPCKHMYHEDCVSSWCSNHTRCPLCNFDLESVAGDTSTIATSSTF